LIGFVGPYVSHDCNTRTIVCREEQSLAQNSESFNADKKAEEYRRVPRTMLRTCRLSSLSRSAPSSRARISCVQTVCTATATVNEVVHPHICGPNAHSTSSAPVSLPDNSDRAPEGLPWFGQPALRMAWYGLSVDRTCHPPPAGSFGLLYRREREQQATAVRVLPTIAIALEQANSTRYICQANPCDPSEQKHISHYFPPLVIPQPV
jgi:hypothetical protein